MLFTNKVKKAELIIIIFISIFLSVSCCQDEEEDCKNRPFWVSCEFSQPSEGGLNVSVSINLENPQVYISVYAVDYEDEALLFIDTLTHENASYTMAVGYYSATVLYISGQDTILAIDGDDITTERVEYCNESCWEVEDADLDLRMID